MSEIHDIRSRQKHLRRTLPRDRRDLNAYFSCFDGRNRRSEGYCVRALLFLVGGPCARLYFSIHGFFIAGELRKRTGLGKPTHKLNMKQSDGDRRILHHLVAEELRPKFTILHSSNPTPYFHPHQQTHFENPRARGVHEAFPTRNVTRPQFGAAVVDIDENAFCAHLAASRVSRRWLVI